ncbi:MAG: alpha-L-rhamnosidase, partial [Armatimonadota bacterium]|nr:alpha-L-rhamnosidase [Armatimonadota bacterium]
VKGIEPSVAAFRKEFSLASRTKFRIHVSADERYELFLDGKRIGRGPQRGDRENWFYESHDLELPAGNHIIVAKTWWLGPNGPSPYAQHTVRPAFLLAAEGVKEKLLNTGQARWECKRLDGYRFINPGMAWGTGAKVHIIGKEFSWGFEKGEGNGWVQAEVFAEAANASTANEFPPIWMLRPAMLPAMLENYINVGIARHVESVTSEETRTIQVKESNHIASEAEAWNRLLAGKAPITIPANTMRRIIIDLGNYYCAYPNLVTTGGNGSKVRILWAEALYEKPEGGSKGIRNTIEGKYFIGTGDIFEPDGGSMREFSTLWWEAGRYLEVLVSTADEPLTIEKFGIYETHYPYDIQMKFETADPRLEEVIPIARRALEMCSHETYMDCPYYEQLQYVGDVRLQVLATYVSTRDDLLPRKAILQFDQSRKNSGITQSRYPSRIMQIIPPFSLWWIGMVHDYAMWRNDMEFVRDRMPGVRAVLDAFR